MSSKTSPKMCLIIVLAFLISAIGNAKADFTFGTPTNLGPTVNSSRIDVGPTISADGRTLYFSSDRPGGYGHWDLWVARRSSVSDPWGAPVNLGPTVNSSAWESDPSISSDGLSLFFNSMRSGGSGSQDIWVTTRATTGDDWGIPVNLGPVVNSSAWDADPSISADGLSLFLQSERPGGFGGADIYVSTRATTDSDWSTPVNIGPTVNSSASEVAPCTSADCCTLFFTSDRPGGSGAEDLWVTTRATTTDDWGTPVNLGPTVNSSSGERAPNISADGLTLLFHSIRPGGSGSYDLWQAPIIPIVDFNGDGLVDCIDILDMIANWGTDNSLYDIGPTPFGDGIVDAQDLLVLAEYMVEQISDVNDANVL